MSKKIKPNKLFEDKPVETAQDVQEDKQDILANVDENSLVGNGRMSAEDAKKLEQFNAMEKSLAAAAEEKTMLEAKVAEYADKLESLQNSADKLLELEKSNEDLRQKMSLLEDKCKRADKLEAEVKNLREENDKYLIKISELTFENANITSQLSDIERRAKANGSINNQNGFQPFQGPQQQMSRRLASDRRDVYNPYVNNGYGSW